MKYGKFFVLACFVLNLCGCSLVGFSKITKEDVVLSAVSGQILKLERIQQGGKILIVPFRPGADVAYDDEFEKITLMIVRGMADVFQEEDAPFEILFSDNADEAEIIIEGRVVDKGDVSRVGEMLGRQKISLSIRGRMIDQKTGQTLAVFTNEKKSNIKEMSYFQLGSAIGQEIGKFLLTK